MRTYERWTDDKKTPKHVQTITAATSSRSDQSHAGWGDTADSGLLKDARCVHFHFHSFHTAFPIKCVSACKRHIALNHITCKQLIQNLQSEWVQLESEKNVDLTAESVCLFCTLQRFSPPWAPAALHPATQRPDVDSNQHLTLITTSQTFTELLPAAQDSRLSNMREGFCRCGQVGFVFRKNWQSVQLTES